MRLIIALALVLLLVLGGVAYYVFNSLDSIVAGLIEEHGSRATGTAVTVGGVEILLTEGKATIRELRVANPPGFESEDAFTLGLITVDLELGSLGSRLVPMSEVVVAAPVVNFEMNSDGDSNLGRIYAHLEEQSKTGDSPDEGGGSAPPDLRIGHFRFEEGQIHVDAAAVDGPQRTLELAPLDLRDVGGSDGASPARVGLQIVSALIQESGKRLTQAGLEDYIDRKLGGETGETVKEILKGILN